MYFLGAGPEAILEPIPEHFEPVWIIADDPSVLLSARPQKKQVELMLAYINSEGIGRLSSRRSVRCVCHANQFRFVFGERTLDAVRSKNNEGEGGLFSCSGSKADCRSGQVAPFPAPSVLGEDRKETSKTVICPHISRRRLTKRSGIIGVRGGLLKKGEESFLLMAPPSFQGGAQGEGVPLKE